MTPTEQEASEGFVWNEDASSFLAKYRGYCRTKLVAIMANALRSGAHHIVMHWKILLLGQLLSLLLASTGAAQATLHLNCSLSAPTFTVGLIYFCLAFHLVPLYFQERRRRYSLSMDSNETIASFQYWFLGQIPLQAPVWAYFIIAILDVEANYLTLLAFRYTTLTSITLFDALAIPSAMLFSRLLLPRRYLWIHMLGVLVCAFGICINVFQDYESDQDGDTDPKKYPHKIRGDVLAIMGGILYGVNDVICEVCVRTIGGPSEFLGMVGFFASLIAIVQASFFERDDILDFFNGSATCSTGMGFLMVLVYIAAGVISYIGCARFLLVSEAAFMNLSLLTGDLWSVVFSIAAERIVPQALFFVALFLIVSGVFIYEMAPSPILEDGETKHDGVGWTNVGMEVDSVESVSPETP